LPEDEGTEAYLSVSNLSFDSDTSEIEWKREEDSHLRKQRLKRIEMLTLTLKRIDLRIGKMRRRRMRKRQRKRRIWMLAAFCDTSLRDES